MSATAQLQGPVLDEEVLDARLVACYRAAELLSKASLGGAAPAAGMAKAQELRGVLVAADEEDLPGLESQIAALEAHLRQLDDGIEDGTFKASLSVVTRGGLLGYGRILLGQPFDSGQRAERFVLLSRWLLARDAGNGRLFLPSREELAALLDQLLVGLPIYGGPQREAFIARLRGQRDNLLMTEDLDGMLASGLYADVRQTRLGSAPWLGDPELLHALLAVEVDLHNFVEDCIAELQASADGGTTSVRETVEQALAQQVSDLVMAPQGTAEHSAVHPAVTAEVADVRAEAAHANAAVHPAVMPAAPAAHPAVVAEAPAAHPAVLPEAPAAHPAVVAEAPAAHPAVLPEAPAAHPAVVPEVPAAHPAVVPEVPAAHPAVVPEVPATHPAVLPEHSAVVPAAPPTPGAIAVEPEIPGAGPAAPPPPPVAAEPPPEPGQETRTLRDLGNEPKSHPMVIGSVQRKPQHSLPSLDLAPPPAPAVQQPEGTGLEVDVEVGLNKRFLGVAAMAFISLLALGFAATSTLPPAKRIEHLEGDDIKEISRFLEEGNISAGHFRGTLSESDWGRLGELARKEEAEHIAEQLRVRAVYGATIYKPEAKAPSIVIDTTRVMTADP